MLNIFVFQMFGLDINKTDFVEAHGTGTPVGDPLEAEGIAQVFTIGNKKRQDPMPIGSSKSNFGHMECAAGMVQVIKTALMLENRVIYPTINYGEPNPAIDFEGWNIRVPTENEVFQKNKPFRVGVNTYGFGGALAHMVFEEATQKLPPQKNKGSAGWKVGKSDEKGLKISFVLSAKSPSALRAYCRKWIDFESNDDAMEVACCLATRRSHYSYRVVIFADSGADLREKMQMYVDKKAHEEIVESTLRPHSDEKKICFVFPGQGQQSFDMGRTLYKDEPVFRRAVDECDRYYKKISGRSFMHTYNLFIPLDCTKKYNPDIINEIQVSQPAILFLQVGLCHLLSHWGINPDVVAGHSLGEVATIYAAGALTLEEAVIVQYYRAEAQLKLDGTGSMAAFRVSAEEGEKLCQNYKDLYVACNNAHENITIAGPKTVITKICADNPGNAKELRVKCAYHTPHMDPLKDEFMQSMEGKLQNRKPTKCTWYSTVTGHSYDGEVTSQYFWDNMREEVLFLDAVRRVMEDHYNVLFLEIAGAATLLSAIRSIAKVENYTPSGMVPCGQRQKDDRLSALRALATLHGLAIEIDWGNVFDNCGRWMRLPPYAWQHSTFCYESEAMKQRRLDLEDNTYHGLNGVVRLEKLPFLRDHVINGKLSFPRSGYVEYILQTHLKENDLPVLSNVKFHPETLELSGEDDLNGEVPERKILRTKSVKIRNGERIDVECDGIVLCQAVRNNQEKRYQQVFDIEQLMKRCPVEISSDDYYAKFADRGLEYIDSMCFKAVKTFYLGDGEAFAELQQATDKRERVNTIILDAAFTVAMAAQQKSSTLLSPISIDRIELKVGQIPRNVPLFVYTRLNLADAVNLVGDIYIMNGQGQVLVEIKQFTAKNISGSVTPKLDLKQCLYTREWQPIDACLPPTTMLQEFFSEENLCGRYPEEMNAITIAEKYNSLIKEICAAYAKHAVDSVQTEDINPKMKKYATRLRQMAETTPKKLKYEDIKQHLELIEKACPEYQQEMLMIERLGNSLPEALKDPRCALSELCTEEMMNAYFLDSLTIRIYYKALADVVRKAVEGSLESKKIVQVLEIGGRLGALSQYICAALEDLLKEGKVEYVFTDISTVLFHRVQERLRGFKNIRFQQLDIKEDIKTQNFVANSMDIVVCLDTLHCTENTIEATSNMRDLLCKDGWGVLMESTNNLNTPEIIFGALDLCWTFEDERRDRCWMSQSEWSGVMQKAGFSDVVAVSTPNEFYHSLIVGRKTNMSLNYPKYHVEDETAESRMEVDCEKTMMFFVGSPIDDLAKYVCKKMDYNGSVIRRNDFEIELKARMPLSGPVMVVYFSETDAEVIDALTILKRCTLLESGNNKLWVVIRGTERNNTDQAATAALVRTAISEMKNIDVYMVHLDQSGLFDQTRELCTLLRSHTHTDREIAIQNGQVFVPRMLRQSLTKKLGCNGSEWQVEVVSTEEDRLDEIDFHASHSQNPGPGEVRVIVQATAINEKDISAMNNKMHPRSIKIASECAGIVASVGLGVTNVKSCDKVLAFRENCLASSIIVPADKVFKKPPSLSAVECAGSGIAYANAVFALLTRARLKKGQTVLIHSACTGVGQACIEVAKLIGANIICTESSEGNHAYLKGQCHIHNVSDSITGAFYDDVMNWTSKRGVDVVMNFAGGRIFEQSISCLSHGGHLCQVGGMHMFENSQLLLNALIKNVSVHTIQIEELMQKEPSAFYRLMLDVLKQMEDGVLHPIPTSMSNISDVIETARTVATQDIVGRLVVEVPLGFAPEVQPPRKIFKPDATYVVTGSCGGIGQEVSHWLVRNGAKHIALVSKQGHHSWFQKSTICQLEEYGATVYEIRADLSKENTIKETFQRLTANGKPSMKGIFHLAGLNEDAKIENANSKQVEESLNTRGRSALWIHEVTKELSCELDHFVLFSSSKAAWGNPNLAAFNSSCGMLDALATQRREEGLPALSVQAGWLRGAGWLEDKSRASTLEKFTKGSSLHVREFLSLLHKVLLRTDLPPVVMLANEVRQQLSDGSMSICRGSIASIGIHSIKITRYVTHLIFRTVITYTWKDHLYFVTRR